jgi:hypothetical protein
MKIRITLLLVLAMILATAGPAMAAPKDVNIDLRSPKTAAVTAGTTAWVAIDWLAKGGDADDFQVTVAATGGVEVWYPYKTSNEAEWIGEETFTSLWGDKMLSESELDFTAVRLQVPADAPNFVDLELTVKYTTNGQDKTNQFKTKVPIVQYEGQDLEQLSDAPAVALAAATAETVASPWVEVSYAGFAPILENFSVSVTDTAGLEIAYPLDGSSTSLSHNSTLEGGETDFVAFKIIEPPPGTYELAIEATYTKGGTPFSLPGSLTVNIP